MTGPGNLPPLQTHDGFVLWADLRLDNRPELITQLDPAGAAGPLSDAELVLSLYRRSGESCIEKLIGDFAFVLWDPRRRRAICARDHFGVRPLYYVHQPGRLFLFASNIRPLLDASEVSPRENEFRIGEYLARVSVQRTATFYKEIVRLPAGHWLSVGPEASTLRRYWRPFAGPELRLASDTEYADAFRTVFTEAVHCRLPSDAHPIATTLSGGLDSSSIACVARGLLRGTRHELHSVSAVFPGLPPKERKRADESHYIEQVLAGGSLQPHFVAADCLTPLNGFDHILELYGEPFHAPNLYLHWGLFHAAAGTGARVFLDGLDGDSAISDGIDLLPELARNLRFATLLREASALSQHSPAKPGTRRVFWEYGLSPALSPYIPFRRNNGPRGIVNPGFAHRIGLQERILSANARPHAVSCREKHAESLDAPAHQAGLESFYQAASTFGLEARFPFFDRRLLEFSLSLPAEQKLRNGWTRLVLRNAMDGILPTSIQWRFTKGDLSPNFCRGLAGPDRNIVADVVHRPPPDLGEYVDLAALRESFHRFMSRPAAAESDAVDLYSSVMLAQWLTRRAGHRGLLADRANDLVLPALSREPSSQADQTKGGAEYEC